MKRFWFEFEFDDVTDYPFGVGYGCGVTAIDYDDAINLLKQKVFKAIPIPKIRKQIENVNVNDLDQGHVVLNMNPPNYRGIWFPRGYNY